VSWYENIARSSTIPIALPDQSNVPNLMGTVSLAGVTPFMMEIPEPRLMPPWVLMAAPVIRLFLSAKWLAAMSHLNCLRVI
jgi:hypothetical protein